MPDRQGYFDKTGHRITFEQWRVMFAEPRVLDHEEITTIIETVWTGVPMSAALPPQVFVTQVVGGALDGCHAFAASEAEAHENQRMYVQRVRALDAAA